MMWMGKDLITHGEISTAVEEIIDQGTRHDAQMFMALYRAETVHAHANVGYLAGYLGGTKMQKVFDWFQCAHPVFGTYEPTPEEAFKMGQRWMEGSDGKSVAFHYVRAEDYPFLVEFLNADGDVVHNIYVTGPGAIEVPSLKDKYGPITARTTYASGEVFTAGP
jgi:hypothetical protein